MAQAIFKKVAAKPYLDTPRKITSVGDLEALLEEWALEWVIVSAFLPDLHFIAKAIFRKRAKKPAA
jgi:hypothetical protein